MAKSRRYKREGFLGEGDEMLVHVRRALKEGCIPESGLKRIENRVSDLPFDPDEKQLNDLQRLLGDVFDIDVTPTTTSDRCARATAAALETVMKECDGRQGEMKEILDDLYVFVPEGESRPVDDIREAVEDILGERIPPAEALASESASALRRYLTELKQSPHLERGGAEQALTEDFIKGLQQTLRRPRDEATIQERVRDLIRKWEQDPRIDRGGAEEAFISRFVNRLKEISTDFVR